MSKNNRGFTLIELMFVMVIITIALLIIVPRAYRTMIDAKYAQLRQSCAELASRGTLWAETEVDSQDDANSTAFLADYYNYLCGSAANLAVTGFPATGRQQWVSAGAASANIVGWRDVTTVLAGRSLNNVIPATPAKTASAFMPALKTDKNPFNAIKIFDDLNDPATQLSALPGAISCGAAIDASAAPPNTFYLSFAFQGVDSTGFAVAAPATTFADDAGVTSLNLLRNGVFWIRIQGHP